MEIGDLFYVIFAVGVFHVVAVGLFGLGMRRSPGWSDVRVRSIVHRTLAASVALVALYLTVAVLAFQFLPVAIGYPVFVAAWAVYGLLLMSLLIFGNRRACRRHAASL